MKTIILSLTLLTLTACEGSSAKGFWGESAPTGVWDQEKTPLCEFYNNCGSADSAPADSGGNAPATNPAPSEIKSCELYGNCE